MRRVYPNSDYSAAESGEEKTQLPFTMDMIEYIETQSRDLDRRDLTVNMMAAACQYVSCIRVKGVPILPPVLSTKKKEEMRSYKHQALMVEKKLQSKQRERLFARAERVVKNTQKCESTSRKTSMLSDTSKEDTLESIQSTRPVGLSETGQFDSLSSGLVSLEDTSLPTDFYGLPCTSVHEQQISHVLQKLSKQLNLKDTLGSTGGSECNENTGNGTFTNISPNVGEGRDEDGSVGFRDSQDTVVEVLRGARKSKPPAIHVVPQDDSVSNKDSPSRGYVSGDSSNISSANTSASERARVSPKSLKNTVHFAECIKVLDDSLGDKITVKRLEDKSSGENMPVNKPTKVITPVNKTSKEKPETNTHSLKRPSLLSQVVLSPETDPVTPSPDLTVDVPFQAFNSPPADTVPDTKVKSSNKSKSCSSPKLKSGRDSDSDSSEKKFPQSQIKRNNSLRSSNRSRNATKTAEQSHKGSTQPNNQSQNNLTLSDNQSQTNLASSDEYSQKTSSQFGDHSEIKSSFSDNQSLKTLSLSGNESLINSSLSVDQTRKTSSQSSNKSQKNTTLGQSVSKTTKKVPVSSSQESTSTHTSSTDNFSSSLATADLFETGTVGTSIKSLDHTNSVSTINTTYSYTTDQNSQYTSVTDSQISARTDFTLRTSDSGSTIKADFESSQNVVDSTGSANLYRYMKHIEGTLDNSPNQSPRSNSVAESTDSKIINNVKSDTHSGKKKTHTRKGSYTLDMPSPVLIQAQSKRHENGGGVLGVETADIPASDHSVDNTSIDKPIQRKLDYEEDDLEDTRPVSLPVPPSEEAEGKVEHINRYLNQVQKQKYKDSPHDVPASSIIRDKNSSLDSTASDLLLKKIQDTQNLSDEEALALQSAYIDALKQQLVEQQKSELEELFVEQRREQIYLQTEINSHQKQRKKLGQQTSDKKPKSNRKNLQGNEHETDNQNSSFVSNLSPYGRPASRNTPKQLMLPTTSTPSPKLYRPVVRSPLKPQSINRGRPPVRLPPDINDIEIQLKFFKVTALAKGFLTRRLLHSEKVQELIKTIRDTREFAFNFQAETPIKSGTFSNQDRYLLERIIAQLQAALLDIHEIFFLISITDRMELIRQTRQKQEERRYLGASSTMRDSGRKVSSATLKAIERKRKAQEEEISGSNVNRPKTAPATSSPRPSRSHAVDLRALKPLQGQISPIRSDGSSSNTNNHRPTIKERPKTAPEKCTKEQLASKNRKISNAAPTTTMNKTKTPTSNSKPAVKMARKVSSMSDKAWR